MHTVHRHYSATGDEETSRLAPKVDDGTSEQALHGFKVISLSIYKGLQTKFGENRYIESFVVHFPARVHWSGRNFSNSHVR